VNVGYLCNQECGHCHHRAGPKREEVMAWNTMQAVIDRAKEMGIGTVDITGGAPEMNPRIRPFVRELRRNGHTILFRTNLTAFLEEGYRDIPQFLRENRVEIIASLPCYFKDETDQQRGEGVFIRSIKGLKVLNSEGFGTAGGLPLHLVYNPYEAFLPPPQSDLEKDYRRILMESYGIEFTDLYTITNMPMGRFWEDIRSQGLDEAYMKLLVESFNPSTLGSLMCLGQVNVGWDGSLYDCDFNQAMGMDTVVGKARTIFELEGSKVPPRTIRTADHCYGCTAGSGSSCGGALVK
jgi:radical SAM/Cys-rich protein